MIYYFCREFNKSEMKKLGILLMVILGLGLFSQSCNDGKTYAELKEEEREAILRFIELNKIKVIDEDQFEAQDSTTNVAANEYVLFEESGVYMQVAEKGNDVMRFLCDTWKSKSLPMAQQILFHSIPMPIGIHIRMNSL